MDITILIGNIMLLFYTGFSIGILYGIMILLCKAILNIFNVSSK